jgi:hypothetical protein
LENEDVVTGQLALLFPKAQLLFLEMLVNLAKRRFVKNNTGLSKEKTLFTSTTVLLCFFQFIL